jgi:putative PIN family toxin of toxin-antitoxin system
VKVFLDTNVLMSAFAARGLCADLFRFLLVEHEVQTGEVNLGEPRRALRERFAASPELVDAAEQLRREQTVVPRPERLLDLVIRNADDVWVLASAVDGAADLLVTGDQDGLSVAADAPLEIVSPREARKRLRGWRLVPRPRGP